MIDYSTRQRAGFVLGAIVALLNLPGAFIPTGGGADSESAGPPVAVLVLGAVLGLAAAALLLWGWRTGRRGPVRAAAVLLILNAITSLPAFFVAGVPSWVRLVAGLYVLATVAAVILLFSSAGSADRATDTSRVTA